MTKTEHLIALFVIKMYIFYTAQFLRHKLRHHLCVSIELLESFRTNDESDYEYEIWKKVLKSMRKVSNLVRRTRRTTSLK